MPVFYFFFYFKFLILDELKICNRYLIICESFHFIAFSIWIIQKMKTMKSKEGVFLFLSTLFLISSFAFNIVFFNIAKFKVDTKVNPDNHSLNYRVHFDFLDELKAPKTLVKGLNLFPC